MKYFIPNGKTWQKIMKAANYIWHLVHFNNIFIEIDRNFIVFNTIDCHLQRMLYWIVRSVRGATPIYIMLLYWSSWRHNVYYCEHKKKILLYSSEMLHKIGKTAMTTYTITQKISFCFCCEIRQYIVKIDLVKLNFSLIHALVFNFHKTFTDSLFYFEKSSSLLICR